MSLASRTAYRLGVTIAGVLGIFAPGPVLASRPVTTVAIARAGAYAEIGTGHSVSGGGRGGRQVATHRDPPPTPPTTQPASPSFDGCLVAQRDDGGRRTPQPRTTSHLATSECLRVVRVVDVVHDGRGSVEAAVFHDAHAPPMPATDVAGLLA